MKKPFTKILWGTLVFSVISTIAIIVSISTQYWIVATAVSGSQNQYVSEINYGLIFGLIERRLEVSTGTNYRLTITCILGNNICAWSCLDDERVRSAEIEELYDSGAVTFSCRSIGSQFSSDPNGKIKLQDNSTSVKLEEIHARFMNATLWLGTVICLIVSGLFCLLAGVITGMNIYFIPLKTFLTIEALYVWHCIAGLISLFTLLLWGSMFLMTLSKNVATVDTIMGTLSSDGRANFGFSYWLNILPFILEGGCVGLLYFRQTLLEKKPANTFPIEVESSISHLY